MGMPSSFFEGMVTVMQKKHLAKAAVLLVGLVTIFYAVDEDGISSSLLTENLRGVTTKVYIPPSLDPELQRHLSLDMGGGNCKWMPPVYDVPEDEEFHKSLVVGFPSGDKRMVYLQMEALAGFPAKDEWDFAYVGMTNHPFIKANYPHHEGLWGWGTVADQVIMLVPNMRRSMVEYHDILYDLGYATNWHDANLLSDNLYEGEPDTNDYHEWRDSRVLDEAHWYGWFIDYWMEGGLMRDVFSHQLTTKEHWDDILLKPFYTRAELDISNYVPDGTDVTPTFDPHCANGEVTDGCEPVAIISADKLRNANDGKEETNAIATALKNDDRTGHRVIASRAWNCIWRELIQSKKGPKIMADRPNYKKKQDESNFSAEMLQEMLLEQDRLIAKYDSPEWNTKPTAIRLVEILVDHRNLVQAELNEVNSGMRKLKDTDFLGPKERARRRDLRKRQDVTTIDNALDKKDHSRYFIALEQKRFENKRRVIKGARKQDEANIPGESMSDGDFMDVLSNALSQIRTLEAAGTMSQETASDLVDKVKDVALVGKVAGLDLGEGGLL